MKKAIAYLLCLFLCISVLPSCRESQVYYRSYSTLVYADWGVLEQMPNRRDTFSIYQFWHYTTDDVENKNPAQKLTAKIGDMQLVGEYQGIAPIGTSFGGRSYLRDKYLDFGNYSFYVNRENGKVVYLYMGDSEELRTLADLENPREETERIARKWSGYYIEDLSAYTTKFQGKEGGKYYDIYHYSFRRYINNIPTTDYIEIDITSKGTLAEINCEEVDAFRNVTFDMSAVEESMDKFVRDAWRQFDFSIVSYEIHTGYPYVCLTIDKQVAVVAKLEFQLKDPNGNECEAGVNMVTLVSTDPNKVIATRLNPFTQ